MTKTIKMSLAAVVAVAGISSTVSAKTLDEAIKGVDVSGYVDYRKEVKDIEDGATTDLNEYSVNVTLTSKVNDMVKATVSAGFDEVTTSNNNTAAAATQDTFATVGVDKAYFTFDMGAATVMAGKQDIPSAFVDQKDTVKQGAGIVASTKMGGVTLAAAHFWNNNIAADTRTTELVVAGKAGMVKYGVNYNQTAITNADADSRYSLMLGAKVGPADLCVRHSAAEFDAETAANDDVSVTKVAAKAKFGKVGVAAVYFMTGEDVATNLSIDGDNDAKVQAKVWQLSTKGVSETTGMVLGVNADVMSNVNAGLTYATADVNDGAATVTETLATVTYKMSKNFKLHGRYSVLTNDATDLDTQLSRLEAKYSF